MTTFSDPPDEAVAILKHVLNTIPDHAPLVKAGVTIALRFATAQETAEGEMPHALKLHGYPCYAIAKIRNYKDRTEGLSDAKIEVCSAFWMNATYEKKVALLDHECMHFEVVYGDDGEVMVDDFHRPRLSTRKHEFDIGWFFSVARRHGMNSVECQQAKVLLEDAGQYLFPGLVSDGTDGGIAGLPLPPTPEQILAAIDRHAASKEPPSDRLAAADRKRLQAAGSGFAATARKAQEPERERSVQEKTTTVDFRAAVAVAIGATAAQR